MTQPVINLVTIQDKVKSLELLLSKVRHQLHYMPYEMLCDLERQVQEFVKKPETDTPKPLSIDLLPGLQQTLAKTSVVYVGGNTDWRDEIPAVVYRAVAVQRGDTGNIDAWMRNIQSDRDAEAGLLNSTFGDLFLDDSDIEEIIEAVLTHIRKHTNTAHYTFFFDTKFQDAMLEAQNTVDFLIKSIQEEIAKTTFP